jgi:hypothetical protein
VTSAQRPIPGRILNGGAEPIFQVLPQSVIANMDRASSENALLWNLIYRIAHPRIALTSLLKLPPLWGTPALQAGEDELLPYFWGYATSGERLPYLDEVLGEIDGPGKQTEADLFLVGQEHLVLVEAKHLGLLGRCSRFGLKRCPEVHPESTSERACRYWDVPGAQFLDHLNWAPRPAPLQPAPPCSRHYQLGRTLLVGAGLARKLGLRLHVWLILPKARWRTSEREWLDFVDRIRDHELWRRMRVLSWESIRELPLGS